MSLTFCNYQWHGWNCCAILFIIIRVFLSSCEISNLRVRRSCFHCQHSRRTERVCNVHCRGNILSSCPHKDQPGGNLSSGSSGSRGSSGSPACQLARGMSGQCLDHHYDDIIYAISKTWEMEGRFKLLRYDLWRQETIWRRGSYQTKVSHLGFHLTID